MAVGARFDAQQSALRIGFDNPFEPFAWMEDGQAKGMLIDVVADILA